MCLLRNGTQLSLLKVSYILNSLEAECIATTVIIGCSVSFFGSLIVHGLIAALYYYRWKVRYLLFRGRRVFSPFQNLYHSLEGHDIQFEYDVYISYHHDFYFSSTETLHEFVIQRIYPVLRQIGFKIQIRDELAIGMKLFDDISKALRKCYRVIVLLTNNYCADYWNVIEFNIAVMEGIYSKRQVVIPVLLESLNEREMHGEVYASLKSNIIPRYTSDISDRAFIDYLNCRIRNTC